MRRLIIFGAFLLLSLTVAMSAAAQNDTCSTFVNQALQSLSSNCGGMSRNTACYGYNHVTATFSQPFTPSAFAQPNDRVQLTDLQSITTAPLDVQTSQWGIAVLKLQTNLPDALPGQAVTFMLLGDVHLSSGVTTGSDQQPMQAIYFTTGIGDTKCKDAPQSSLIIQGPQNVTVNLRVNGADVQFGSTLIFRSTANSTMECGVVDGAAKVGNNQTIPAGFAARVPLDASLNANGDWGGNQPLQDQDATALQVLKEVPDDVLNYAPDVPTADEVNLLAALPSDFVDSFDSHELRALVRLMIAEGDTPEMVSEWSVDQLQTYVSDHADELSASTEEPSASDQVSTEAPSVNDQSSSTDPAPADTGGADNSTSGEGN